MILVTGGAGFIGANFVRLFLSERPGEPLINLDRLTYAGNLRNLSGLSPENGHVFVHGDIGDRELMSELLETHRPRAIINFAAESHVDRSINSAGEFIQTNVVGLFHLLEAARGYWLSLPAEGDGGKPTRDNFRFLHVSTDEVYGTLSADDPPFSETNAYQPNSPYSASKAAGDHLVRAWHHTYDLPTITTNCSNNYGSYQFPEKLIPLAILNALHGKPIPIYGDGQQIRDWLHVEDHCRAIIRVLDRGRSGEVYNVGGGSEKRNLEVAGMICDLLDRLRPRADGGSYRSQISFVKDRPGHDRRYSVDTRKIARELGWEPQETFETGLERTVRWYLDNPEWIEAVQSGAYREWVHTQYGALS